ncbi:hypothetical protein [Streptomyces sp. SID5910]|uniref:hypothetical protein n=1 Tax=Streptomyces sp. SID5910 TaxID=2690312 RepID=UPI00136DB5A5|nr:hypothetical protein [Streptomyces sp. SID5910]MYR43087.1 hypothetical protein [Streptomyces sp. SID5910]
MTTPVQFTTFDGGTIDVDYIGNWVDIHLRAPNGRTVATVEMSVDDANHLIRQLEGCTPDEAEERYIEGYSDGYEAA